MRYEPTIDRAHLIETVRDVYRLPVEELVFVPVGVPSVCYSVHCGGEAREGMEAYGFAQWSALDETFDGIAVALRHSTRTRFAM